MRNATDSATVVSIAGSSGKSGQARREPRDRAAEPLQIMQGVADEIAERAATVGRARLPAPHAACASRSSRRSRSPPRGGARRSRPRRSAPWPCATAEFPGSRSRSWPADRRRRCRSMAAALSRSTASGFSTNTGLPRSSARTAIAGCRRGGVAIATASTSACSTSSSQRPNARATAAARASFGGARRHRSRRAQRPRSADPRGTPAAGRCGHSCSPRCPDGSRLLPLAQKRCHHSRVRV